MVCLWALGIGRVITVIREDREIAGRFADWLGMERMSKLGRAAKVQFLTLSRRPFSELSVGITRTAFISGSTNAARGILLGIHGAS